MRGEEGMRILLLACYVTLASCLVQGSLFAKPERLEIQSDERKAKKAQAKTIAKSVDLAQVKDPEVRSALQAIFNALNLETRVKS